MFRLYQGYKAVGEPYGELGSPILSGITSLRIFETNNAFTTADTGAIFPLIASVTDRRTGHEYRMLVSGPYPVYFAGPVDVHFHITWGNNTSFINVDVEYSVDNALDKTVLASIDGTFDDSGRKKVNTSGDHAANDGIQLTLVPYLWNSSLQSRHEAIIQNQGNNPIRVMLTALDGLGLLIQPGEKLVLGVGARVNLYLVSTVAAQVGAELTVVWENG